MENWAEKMNADIDEKLKGARDKDLRFFRIGEFKRNVSRIEGFSNSCPVCRNLKHDTEFNVATIDIAVGSPGKTRREYDKLISRIASHIKKEHGFLPPYYFTYLYSFFGVAGGIFFGFFLVKTAPMQSAEAMATIGFVVALLVAYFLGRAKDKQIRASKKIM